MLSLIMVFGVAKANVRQVYAAATSGLAPATFQSWVPIVTDHGRHPNWSTDGTLVYHFSFRD